MAAIEQRAGLLVNRLWVAADTRTFELHPAGALDTVSPLT